MQREKLVCVVSLREACLRSFSDRVVRDNLFKGMLSRLRTEGSICMKGLNKNVLGWKTGE